MTPYYADEWLTVYAGDCRAVMASMEPESVHCVVTSPPYWGLRDYGDAGQLGLEPTPEEYVAGLVGVFREVRRVLRSDGTVWLNLGDSYAAQGGRGEARMVELGRPSKQAITNPMARGRSLGTRRGFGLKPKDLVGIPWRVAFALQADGWYLRSDIIWAKPNPMPESVTDRPTKSHEMIFLLSKSPRYYFDADAVREGVGETGVVEGSNGHGEPLVFGQDFRLESQSAYSNAVGVRLASAILERTGRQHKLSLSALDAEVGQERGHNGTSAGTVGDPIMRRAATEAARFADGDVAAKEFLREIDRLCVALPDGHDLKELRAGCAASVLVDADGDGAVAIDDAREVGQLQLIHDEKYTAGVTTSSRQKVTGRGLGKENGKQPGRQPQRSNSGGFPSSGRNLRSVWTIATQPYPGAHFAVFPRKLVEPCVKAGSPEGGVVLDPFAGSGTTGLVAQSLSRCAVLIDLNADYLIQAMGRNRDIPLGLVG